MIKFVCIKCGHRIALGDNVMNKDGREGVYIDCPGCKAVICLRKRNYERKQDENNKSHSP